MMAGKKKDRMDFEAFRKKDGKKLDAATKKVVNQKIDEFMELTEEQQVLFSWFIVVEYLGIIEVAEGDDPGVLKSGKEFGGGMFG